MGLISHRNINNGWQGQALAEYMPTLTTIGSFAIVILFLLGNTVANTFQQVNDCLEEAQFGQADTCQNNSPQVSDNSNNNNTGNSSGNSTGNNTGNSSGNSSGNSTGNNTGNSSGGGVGNTSGNSTGNTTGDSSGNSTGDSGGNTEESSTMIMTVIQVAVQLPHQKKPKSLTLNQIQVTITRAKIHHFAQMMSILKV